MDSHKDPAAVRFLPPFIKRHFQGRPYFRQVTGNIAWSITDNVLRLSIALVVGIWLARYLGPSLFGELNFAMALVGMFGVVASLGIDSNIMRDLVREPDKRNEILGTAFLLKIASALVSIIGCLAVIFVLRPRSPQTIWLVAILSTGMLLLPADVISLWFQAQLAAKYIVYAKNIAYVIGALIRVGLILGKAPLIAFAWATLAESVLVGIGLAFGYYIREGRFPTAWTLGWSRAKAMLDAGWPLLLSAVGSVLYMRVDAVMLGQMSTDHAVGIYGAATRISEIWYFIPMAVSIALQPALISMQEKDAERFQQQLTRIYSLFSFGSFFVSICVALVADKLVTLLYGESYLEAGPVLRLHIWASIAVFLGVVSNRYLIIKQLQKIILYRTLIGMLSNILLNLLFIPSYGVIGSAWATLISYSMATASLVLFPSTRQQGKVMLRTLLPDQWLRSLRGKNESR